MFMKGTTEDGYDVDNTTEAFVAPWLETIKEIAPREVMITLSIVKHPTYTYKRLHTKN